MADPVKSMKLLESPDGRPSTLADRVCVPVWPVNEQVANVATPATASTGF